MPVKDEQPNDPVVLKVTIPHFQTNKSLKYEATDLIWTAKCDLINRLASSGTQDVPDMWNWGLLDDAGVSKVLSNTMKAAGKRYLDDGKSFGAYGLSGEISISFSSRKKPSNLTEKEAAKINNKKAQKKLTDAIEARSYDKVKEELNKGIDPNFITDTGSTPLCLGAISDDRLMLKVLVDDGGAFVDFRTADCKTPLHVAAANNKCISARWLVLQFDSWIDVLEVPSLSTPLHLAAAQGHDDVLRLLLSLRANPNVKDQAGKTPVHLACAANQIKCLSSLLEYGALINEPNATGNTPLHMCATMNAIDCAKELLKRGANRDPLNRTSQTAQQVAVSGQNYDLADAIRNFSPDSIELLPSVPAKLYYDYVAPSDQERLKIPPSTTPYDANAPNAQNTNSLSGTMGGINTPPSRPSSDTGASGTITRRAAPAPPQASSQSGSFAWQTAMAPPPPAQYGSVAGSFESGMPYQSAFGQNIPARPAPPNPTYSYQPAGLSQLPPPPPALPDFTAQYNSVSPPPPPALSDYPAQYSNVSPPPPPALSDYSAQYGSLPPPPQLGSPMKYPHEPPPPLPQQGYINNLPAPPPPPLEGRDVNGMQPMIAPPQNIPMQYGVMPPPAMHTDGMSGFNRDPNLMRVMATFTPDQRLVFKTLLEENSYLEETVMRLRDRLAMYGLPSE